MTDDATQSGSRRRKDVRLKGYDYRQPGEYFVTICTEQRMRLFGTVRDGEMRPNEIGEMVVGVWNALPGSFPGIALDAMMLMPDPLHGIVVLGCAPEVPTTPALGEVVRSFKGRTTTVYFSGVRRNGWEPVPGRLWQLRYFDRIIRNERELEAIRTYIEDNPYRWEAKRRGEG